MGKIFFLINSLKEFNFNEEIKNYLSNYSVTVGESLPRNIKEYELIVIWNFRKIINNIPDNRNIMIFHSSELPDGKGWAPIYHNIARGLKFHTVSGILANEKVDSGDIVVMAKFPLKDTYTATLVRKWDKEICILLVKKVLEHFENRVISGKKQKGEGTFYPKREPSDNYIPFDSRISDVINHLRACEEQHPAHFFYKNTKYIVSIKPEKEPEFPKNLKITFFDNT
tara:strand:- start:5404 stop:6081 length:678 start_codon:yes stop_codon:yes gene_type:complete